MIQALLPMLRPRPAAAEPSIELQPTDIVLPNGRLTRPPSSHVLMLDIDGVLHPAQSGTLLYLPLLEAWLRQHTVIDVVMIGTTPPIHRALFGWMRRQQVSVVASCCVAV